MKTRLIFLAFSIWIFNAAFAQNCWSTTSNSLATSESQDIVMDAAGNSYVTGYVSGDTKFQGIELEMPSGYANAFVAKINASGVYQWVKFFGGTMSDKGVKLVLTPSDEIIFTGTYFNSITFGTTTLTSVSGSKDIFLVKLDNNGDVLWARSDGGNMGDNPYGLALDALGNIILTGQFQGTSTIAGSTFTSIIDPLTTLYSYEMFLAKYDANGTPQWCKASYAEYEDRGIAVTCDASNNIYLTGQFSDTINLFGTVVNNSIYNTGFVSRFDPAGNMIWFDKLAAAQVLAYDIELDLNQQLVVTGDFLGQMVIWDNDGFNTLSNPYSRKIFVMKLKLNGEYIWGTANGSESEVSSRGITIDSNNDIYIGGHFRCNFDEFRDATGTAYWQSAGFRDIFVNKYSAAGNLIWNSHAAGQRDDVCWGIDVFTVDYPIFTGSYGTTLHFPYNAGGIPFLVNNGIQTYSSQSNGSIYNVTIPGDLSANALVSKLLNVKSRTYSYYANSGASDSLAMHINPDVDSLDICLGSYVSFKTNTVLNLEPIYQGSWNTGENWTQIMSPSQTDGLYIVDVQRLDGCYGKIDSIYLDYHPFPELPLLTDDHNINIATKEYKNINVCPPDTLQFWFQNLDTASVHNLKITGGSTVFYDGPVRTDTVFSSNVSIVVSVYMTTDWGCIRNKSFSYTIAASKTYDSIVPYLQLYDTYDHNDSMMICRGSNVGIFVCDSITNPTGLLKEHGQPFVKKSTRITRNGKLISTGLTFAPDSTGWYVVQHQVTLGYLAGTCQPLDTAFYAVADSFYVEVKDKQSVQILGEAIICPETYNYLYVNPVLPGLTWTGTNILWTSDDKDSIKFVKAGTYGVSGTISYGEVSCPFSNQIYIQDKKPPLIYMNPADGIVCPNDSVLLYLNAVGLSYEWIGPEGFPISTAPQIYAKDQGFYACHFVDLSGCPLLTTPAEVKEYITPFIELAPTNVICGTGTVQIYAIYGGNASVQWLAPLNSTADMVTVHTAGTYSCAITQCGVTVIDSVVIIDGSFDVKLDYVDSILCYGDTILVRTDFGYPMYDWSNGMMGTAFVAIADPGDYFVKVTNEYGCVAYSDTLKVEGFPESMPPLVSGTTICPGEDVFLEDTSGYVLNWYADTTEAILYVGSTINFTNVTEDTLLFAAYSSDRCPLAFKEIKVDVLEPLLPPSVSGNLSLCVGETLEVTANSIPGQSFIWVHDGDTISYSNPMQLPDVNESTAQNFTVYISDKCSSASNNFVIDVHGPSPISISTLADTLCYGEQLEIISYGFDNVQFIWSDGTSEWNMNDLYINAIDLENDTISVYGINAYGCHSDTLEVTLSLSTKINFGLTVIGSACLGSSLTLDIDDLLGSMTWQLPDGSTLDTGSIIFPEVISGIGGTYTVSFTDTLGCYYSDSIVVDVHSLPVFDLGNDSIICLDDAFDVLAPSGNFTFVWNGTDTVNYYRPDGFSPVTLTAIDIFGCQFTDTLLVQFMACTGTGANIVTANGDGVNEFFTIFDAQLMLGNYLRIFNRWGNLVFEQGDYRNTYSPTDLMDGVYFYEFYPEGLGGERTLGYFQLITH